MINKFIGNGRVTKDIELKQTSSGSSAVSFTLAITRNRKNQNGEYESDFISCIAYKEVAELLSKYVKKGDTIGVDGKIRTGSYKDKNGKSIYVTEVVVENVDFLKQTNKEVKTETLDTKWDSAKDITLSDEELPFY